MLGRVEQTGAAKPKPPAKRSNDFGRRTPSFKPDWNRSQKTLKKKEPDLPSLADHPSFAETPGVHGYPSGVIALVLGLVRVGVSLRATSRVLEFFAEFFGLPFSAPHWTTGRLWLLRFGLAHLTAPKDQADDWIWMVDHSVQVGKEKVLVILGIRLVNLPMPERPLRADDMVLIDLVPMKTSTREDVAARLEAAAARTCVPRAIVDDHGVDLTGGVQIFRQSHPGTAEIYDIKHKAACLLKARLEKNASWKAFCTNVAQTRCAIQQTELGALAPPGSKPKARFMNLEGQLGWAEKVLALLDGCRRPGAVPSWATPERLDEKLGWLAEFRGALAEWQQWQAIVNVTVTIVARDGLSARTALHVGRALRPLRPTGEGRRLATELIKFVREQASVVRPGERLPGSTDVLESSFGRFKTLEKDQAKGGFTSLLLGFGSLFVEATIGNVLAALQRVPTIQVKDWCAEHLGTSLFSQRIEAFALAREAQQKPAEAVP